MFVYVFLKKRTTVGPGSPRFAAPSTRPRFSERSQCATRGGNDHRDGAASRGGPAGNDGFYGPGGFRAHINLVRPKNLGSKENVGMILKLFDCHVMTTVVRSHILKSKK